MTKKCKKIFHLSAKYFCTFAKCFSVAFIIAWICGFILGSGLVFNSLYTFAFSPSHFLNFDILINGIVIVIGAPIVILFHLANYYFVRFEMDVMEDFA